VGKLTEVLVAMAAIDLVSTSRVQPDPTVAQHRRFQNISEAQHMDVDIHKLKVYDDSPCYDSIYYVFYNNLVFGQNFDF